MIVVRSLGKRYGDKEILKGISFDVQRGEVFAVIGPTGAGKTTLLRIIDLLERPTSGAVYIDGLDTSASEKVRLDIRRRIGVVFQKPIVFNASVYDNVAYGLKIRGEEKASLHQKVKSALEMVDLSGYEDRRARTLSGGEVQRVALARAIVIEPEILLLDEPSANLDPVSTAHVEEVISRIIRELNTTVVMATHDMSQGQRLADRIGVLMDGQLLQAGEPREVFNYPTSRKIAEFVAMENIIEGVISSSREGVVSIEVGGKVIEGISSFDPGEEVCACIRAEDITLALSRTPSSARNAFLGQITRVVSIGPLVRVEVDCGFPLVALVTKKSAEELDLQSGKDVYASFKATGVHIIKSKGG